MNVTPYPHVSEGKKEQVEKMFNEIAFRYDLLNQLLSFGIHNRWRKKAISFIAKNNPKQVLDIATGTADFAIEAVSFHPEKITGIDISEEMLAIGRKKVKQKKSSQFIELIQADSEHLPFPDNHFDAATVGFGVRNFENLERGLSEICRTLKKGGTFAVLEFSIPEKFPMKQLYNFYLKNICPLIGRMISKNPVAYTYLFQSVSGFPYGEKFREILISCGFSEVKIFPQTFGIVTIYIAKK
jgi:demethylmenaquinone methyltransferase/2-methoxy-6-polyprenyl-1,4-benzoquinol methylase